MSEFKDRMGIAIDRLDDVESILAKAVAAYKAMNPIEQALHDADQRRSFVRGQSGRDPGEDVLAAEVRSLRQALAAQTARADRAEAELAKAVDRAQRNSDALRDGLKMPGEGPPRFSVWMEVSVGCCFAWLVWAVKPGAARLVAVCSTEAIADRYASNLPPGLSDFKSWKERAPIDHSFGFADSMHARAQGKIA